MASLFAALTGSASETAAKRNAATIATGLNQGGDALRTHYGAGLELLLDGTKPSALSNLANGYANARNDLNTQYDRTQGYLGGIQDLYAPLVQSGQQATDARADALGLNGAEGNARAKSSFEGSLGYNAGLNTGLEGVMRSAAARGQLAGGNTSQDLFNYGADYQNKQAQTYIGNLGTVANNLGTGIAGRSAGLGLQANASQQQGSSLADLGTGLGQSAAGVLGQAAGLQAGLGNAYAGLINGATNAYTENNTKLAQSQNQASGNFLGLLTNAVTGLGGNALKGNTTSGLFKNIFS